MPIFPFVMSFSLARGNGVCQQDEAAADDELESKRFTPEDNAKYCTENGLESEYYSHTGRGQAALAKVLKRERDRRDGDAHPNNHAPERRHS